MGIDQKLSKEARDLGWEEDSYGPCGGAVWFCYESVLMLVPLVCGRQTHLPAVFLFICRTYLSHMVQRLAQLLHSNKVPSQTDTLFTVINSFCV